MARLPEGWSPLDRSPPMGWRRRLPRTRGLFGSSLGQFRHRSIEQWKTIHCSDRIPGIVSDQAMWENDQLATMAGGDFKTNTLMEAKVAWGDCRRPDQPSDRGRRADARHGRHHSRAATGRLPLREVNRARKIDSPRSLSTDRSTHPRINRVSLAPTRLLPYSPISDGL